MSSKKVACVCLAIFSVVCQFIHSRAALNVGFYDISCGMAEFIVKNEVRKGVTNDMGMAAGLLRMHFHDCFVRGCDGSILIDSTPGNPAEKAAPANFPSLQGFEIIDKAKAILESVCPGIVSCADILAFVARDSVEMTRGRGWDVHAGRRDGTISLASEVPANLPSPSFNLSQLTLSFAKKGLSQDEMVTLSGAHTIGRAHCTSVSPRLYNFNTSNGSDSALDPNYAAQLKQQCPQGSTNPNLVVSMDPTSPNTMDTGYYRGVIANRGLFTSDHSLLTDSVTANQANQNALNPQVWQSKFAGAMVKMGNIGVLTGSDGEIRSNCRMIN